MEKHYWGKYSKNNTLRRIWLNRLLFYSQAIKLWVEKKYRKTLLELTDRWISNIVLKK